MAVVHVHARILPQMQAALLMLLFQWHTGSCHCTALTTWRLQDLIQHLRRADDQQEPARHELSRAELLPRPSGAQSAALGTAGQEDEHKVEQMQPLAPSQPPPLMSNVLAVALSPRSADQDNAHFAQPRHVQAAARSFLDAGTADGAQVLSQQRASFQNQEMACSHHTCSFGPPLASSCSLRTRSVPAYPALRSCAICRWLWWLLLTCYYRACFPLRACSPRSDCP